MSKHNYPNCVNPVMGEHENWYGNKYGGYCLDCSNAGAGTLVDALLAVWEELLPNAPPHVLMKLETEHPVIVAVASMAKK